MVPRKLVEHFFRLLPVLILPVIIAPALIFWVINSEAETYQANATVWASDPAGIQVTDLDSFGGRATPASRLASVLNDLLATRSFREDVAVEAGLASPVEDGTISNAALNRGARNVRDSLRVRARGTFLVVIDATSKSPVLAQALPLAVTTEYLSRNGQEANRQLEIATGYYTQQLELAQAEFDSRQSALEAYLAANPGADDRNIAGPAQSEYQILERSMSVQGGLVEDLRQSLQSSLRDAATNELGQEARFTLQDVPQLPGAPLPQSLTKRFGYPMAGVLLGALLSASYLYISYRTDHTVRSTEDLRGTGVPVLGYVPNVSPYDNWPLYRRLQGRQRDFARRVAASIIGAESRQERA